MKLENTTICNVCLISSNDESDLVFIKASKNNEDVDICTSCIPSVIHGSGLVVKSNEEVKNDIANK